VDATGAAPAVPDPDDAGADADATPAPESDEALAYPTDPRDGWAPGAPSFRALLPSAIAGAVIPIAVYNIVRPHVGGDAPALIIAGIPAAVWVVVEWLRKRTVDPIGAAVLSGFVIGVAASYALGGNAFVLKARDSAFTFLFGMTSLVSLALRRPLMFYFGRSFSAGDDPVRMQLYDRLWEMPAARAVFRLITLMWGVGLVVDAAVRVALATALPTATFVAVSPAVSAVFIGTMFAASIVVIRWSREGTSEAMALEVPEGGGSTWWWTRRHFAPVVLGRVLRRGR